ncbi:MAG: TIGR03557 family F420-dependent LLM class oxidoreductase [Actinomycetota bacterium]|nr:TIGR03557 family F420-dependent LLM class oxidoreductase [Actinomycetota bacterium]
MVEVGYALSSEEHRPNDLVAYARRAQDAGFTFALVSDHFHPWTDRQGQSAFVWNVIGAISAATESLRIGTGVTCPILRIHPAIIAQAAATSAAMMPGRFFLGVGTGENLNEHILGLRWPPADVRFEMIEEAVSMIKLLWKGGQQSFHGKHFVVENARIYTLPDVPPPIYMAASGTTAAEVAGRIADGLISTAPRKELVQSFRRAGGESKPCYGQMSVCVAPTEAEGRKIAHEWWPTAGIPGELGQDLPLPSSFEDAAKNVREEDVAKSVLCSTDAQAYIDKIKEFVSAGFDHVYVHQIGRDQERFFRFYEDQVLPKL